MSETVSDVETNINARREPIQERSRKRVNLILDITADLVSEAGIDGVKTTEVARRAGIKLASLYRYFPNKTAILKSLAERQLERMHPRLKDFLDNFDLNDGLDQLIDAYAEFYRKEPGYAKLWSGIQAMPELQELDMVDLEQNTQAILSRAKQAFPNQPEQELRAVAMVITRCIGAILRLNLAVDEELSKNMLKEIKHMVHLYIKDRLLTLGK